ncbi:MAG: DUF6428 family protein [Bacteroidia bacterium]|jgi:hypothetical protein
MKLSTFKEHLSNLNTVNFVLPNGTFVPKHFHVTEVGLITKNFIDCGGTVRTEKVVNFQLWVAEDLNHKLEAKKLMEIISLSEKLFSNEDLEIEVEYQSNTIGKYGLDYNDHNFLLTAKQTNCLAKDNCGIPPSKIKLQLATIETSKSSCTPGGGCC